MRVLLFLYGGVFSIGFVPNENGESGIVPLTAFLFGVGTTCGVFIKSTTPGTVGFFGKLYIPGGIVAVENSGFCVIATSFGLASAK